MLDTGGIIPTGKEEIATGVRDQALKGAQEADLLLFVVDGAAGLTPLDLELAPLLRRSGQRVVLVVNKVDVEVHEGRVSDFFRLGFGEPLPVSAEEGRGIGELLDRLVEDLPPEPRIPVDDREPVVKLAVVGRPNVGKSTLFNRLSGQDRSVVSSLPGTTRDPVVSQFLHRGRRYRIVDTAGLRRKGSAQGEAVEMQSVQRALRSLKEADMVLSVLDAGEPGTHQDRAVVGACLKLRRPLLVVLNKVDRIQSRSERESMLRTVRAQLHFSEEVPLLPTSALKGTGVAELLEALEALAEESSRRISTPMLNAALSRALAGRSPSGGTRPPRLYYVTQTGSYPPSFVIFTNGVRVEPSYRRYLERQFKASLALKLAPVALSFRSRPKAALSPKP